MSEHKLKTDPTVFQAVACGRKNFEIRKDDRGFKEGDTLILQETKFTGEEMAKGRPLVFTGKTLHAEVRYILRGPCYGLVDGWVIMDVAL